jgi:hypothetical protein
MHFRMFWNEQYILQAMLATNPSWAVLWCGAFMHMTHSQELLWDFRSYDPATVRPGSFWMRKCV